MTDMEFEDTAQLPPRARRRWPGVVSLLTALLMVAAGAIGVWLGSTAEPSASLLPAIIALALSVLSFVFGLVAVVSGRGRRLGVVGIVIGILLNPAFLATVFGAFGAI